MTPSQRKHELAKWIVSYMREYATELTHDDAVNLIAILTQRLALCLTERELMSWQGKLRNREEINMKVLMRLSGMDGAS